VKISNNVCTRSPDKASLPKKLNSLYMQATAGGNTNQKQFIEEATYIQNLKPSRNPSAMLLELAIWAIPMTLIFAPCRRLVLLVANLQQFRASIMRTRSSSPALWSRLARLQTISITV
jgi:hypothetical protein